MVRLAGDDDGLCQHPEVIGVRSPPHGNEGQSVQRRVPSLGGDGLVLRLTIDFTGVASVPMEARWVLIVLLAVAA